MIRGLRITIDAAELTARIDERIRMHTAPVYGSVDGLKLTLAGDELRGLLRRRIEEHHRRAIQWRNELARVPGLQTGGESVQPDPIDANQAEQHEWRAAVLTFVHDHVDAGEIYRLGASDLAFGELLPEKPAWMRQREEEERTSLGFSLQRLTNKVESLMPFEFALLDAVEHGRPAE